MRFVEYQDRFEHVQLSRTDGILEVTLHSGGDSLIWGVGPHRELPEAFEAIASDRDTRVVVLTGAGESFCADRDGTLSELRSSPSGWDRIYWEGRRMVAGLFAIEAPVIAAINGPARHHAELPVLADIVLAAEHTVLQDHAHFASGVVPGDGVQAVWPLVLGPNRGRYFLLTGQELSAVEALDLGVVGEVHPRDALLPRARALAAELASRSTLALRYTRLVSTRQLRHAVMEAVEHGLSLEGLALLPEPGE